jgi:hypothetical protein
MKADLLFSPAHRLRRRWNCGDDFMARSIARSADDSRPENSLFYGREGAREVGYDNERGKGDHRHFQGVETAYVFSTVEQLIADFWADVRRLRGTK